MIFRIRCLIPFLFIVGMGPDMFGAEPIMMKSSEEGVDREALIFPPASEGSAAKVPVVFVFHPHGNVAQQAASTMHFQIDWPEALVVYMQGLPTPGLLGDVDGKYPGWQQTPGQLEDRDLKFLPLSRLVAAIFYPVSR